VTTVPFEGSLPYGRRGREYLLFSCEIEDGGMFAASLIIDEDGSDSNQKNLHHGGAILGDTYLVGFRLPRNVRKRDFNNHAGYPIPAENIDSVVSALNDKSREFGEVVANPTIIKMALLNPTIV
jgi:hypothetical protein